MALCDFNNNKTAKPHYVHVHIYAANMHHIILHYITYIQIQNAHIFKLQYLFAACIYMQTTW